MTTWHKVIGEHEPMWEDESGRYRIQRHTVDDSWDTGALVRVNVQWMRSERTDAGDYQPVELHNRLADAKAAVEVQLRKASRDELQERADAIYVGDRAEEVNRGYGNDGPPT